MRFVKRKNIFYPSIGPISSHHDRACELFYQLKGGRVDYGEEHANTFQHRRFGKEYPGLYPIWDKNNPVHIVGHSMGPVTARVLQKLLEDKFFIDQATGKPYNTSAAWIKSITSITGPNNGTTLCYQLGCSEKTGILQKEIEFPPFFYILADIITGIERACPFMRKIYDFDLYHWDLVRAEGESLNDYLRRVAEKKEFVFSEDISAYDLSINAMEKLNPVLTEFPSTYYFSYAAHTTKKEKNTGHEIPIWHLHFFLKEFSRAMGKYRFDKSIFPHLNDEEWWPNDGEVSVFSQEFPRIPREHPHRYLNKKEARALYKSGEIEPGEWNVLPHLKRWGHPEIAMLPRFYQVFCQAWFYRRLFKMLKRL
ncbi:MAG: hypothetical protein GY754_01635 [bacterium]|nr:hypothetical protein [bacterium]